MSVANAAGAHGGSTANFSSSGSCRARPLQNTGRREGGHYRKSGRPFSAMTSLGLELMLNDQISARDAVRDRTSPTIASQINC
jgi:hypothetical protein